MFRSSHNVEAVKDEKFGTIVWDNGADIDPDVLTEGLEAAWMEEESVQKHAALTVREPAAPYGRRKKRSKRKNPRKRAGRV